MLRGGELGTDLFLINGHAHESIPPIALDEGERVLIRLANAGNLPHAVHSHGHSFKIVATDGNPVPKGMELVKDTVLIGPGERYDLELTGTNPGVWMFHCHMENHADNGMMTLIQYDGAQPTGPVAQYFGVGGGLLDGHHGGHQQDASTDVPPPVGSKSIGSESTATAAPPPAAPPAEPSTESTGPANEVEVTIVDDRFDANNLTVPVGTTVRFVNRGANWHSVAAFDGSFESGRIEPGASFTVTFDTPGSYQYICQHHALRGMAGRITVQ